MIYMIVREHQDKFIMIEQDFHAYISGEMIANWKDSLFKGEHFKKSVEYAIYHHDLGWKMIDKQPFWDDEKEAPYSFISFPILPKLIFYKYGIDMVEDVDPY